MTCGLVSATSTTTYLYSFHSLLLATIITCELVTPSSLPHSPLPPITSYPIPPHHIPSPHITSHPITPLPHQSPPTNPINPIPERARKRNCGFVSFKRRGDAEEAKAALHDTDYEGYRMVTRASLHPSTPHSPIMTPLSIMTQTTRATAW